MASSAADRLVNAVLKKVKDSGLLYSGTFMATVSAVGSNGTLTVTRGADTFPDVRLLSGYAHPMVGDTVEIMRTASGWVCLGVLQTARPAGVVDIRAGSVGVVASTANTPAYSTVTFDTPMQGDAFYGQATASSTVVGSVITGVGVAMVSATGLRVYLTRNTGSTTPATVHYTVFGVRT